MREWMVWMASTIVGTALCVAAQAQTPTTSIKTDASWARTPATLSPVISNVVVPGNGGQTHPVPGNVYVIPQNLGRTAGSNLFHSFDTFNVGSGDAAIFTTTSNLGNVISRISGSSRSAINGLLELLPAAGTRPNFFFINPNGITFSAGAQIDVPAALHVSTANNLRFADSTVFNAGAGADSTLTIAPPAAFGFLGTTRAAVQVSDEVLLLTQAGNPFTITAGDILMDNGALATGAAPLTLVAVGQQPLEVPLNGTLPPGSAI
jgi:filamentous hemagglutinin family protein